MSSEKTLTAQILEYCENVKSVGCSIYLKDNDVVTDVYERSLGRGGEMSSPNSEFELSAFKLMQLHYAIDEKEHIVTPLIEIYNGEYEKRYEFFELTKNRFDEILEILLVDCAPFEDNKNVQELSKSSNEIYHWILKSKYYTCHSLRHFKDLNSELEIALSCLKELNYGNGESYQKFKYHFNILKKIFRYLKEGIDKNLKNYNIEQLIEHLKEIENIHSEYYKTRIFTPKSVF